MLNNIECLGHATIKMYNSDKIIYIDPYNIGETYGDADMIFITHSHYDHFSEEDILKLKKETTKIVITEDLYQKTLNLGFNEENITTVKPNEEHKIENIKFTTIPSYNVNKKFHPKENNWVGYIIEIDNVKYYIAGDTDITEENKKVECDVAFLPVGGTYTMTADEAAELANIIQPKIAVPIHYGSIVGTQADAGKFKENLDTEIQYSLCLPLEGSCQRS